MQKCSVCSTQEAIFRCQICGGKLCDACAKIHLRVFGTDKMEPLKKEVGSEKNKSG